MVNQATQQDIERTVRRRNHRLPHSPQSVHSCPYLQTYGLNHANVYCSFCRGVWEWRTGEHILTKEKGSKKRKDRKTQGWAQSWFLLFTVLGWWNQEGPHSWAGHIAHVGQMRNAQIMKGKNRPKRALQNTKRGVRSAWIRFRRRTVMSYTKGTLTVSLSRRTVLCSVGPEITCGFRW